MGRAVAEMSPEQAAALGVWVDRQAAARERLAVNVAGFVRRLFRSLMGNRMYDEVAVARVAREAAAVVRSGQVATSGLTSAYLDQVFANTGIQAPGRVVLPPQEQLRNVDPAEQWQRPAREYRRHVKDGLAELEAMARAEERAEAMARTDLSLAMRETSRQRLVAADDVIGYRRVIHPELSKTGTCGLCIAASDRLYRKAELLPLHDRCKCTVLPATADLDPGRTINDRDIKDLYAEAASAAGGSTAAALKRVRFVIVQHGELGPVLVVKGQHRRTAADARRSARAA